MRLDFNVLWVEDQPERVKAQSTAIGNRLRAEGFRLQVEYAESLDKAKSYLSSEIFGDHIDLVLMDYDLGVGGRGDEGLVAVRDRFPYKDLVFYSAQTENLASLVAARQIEGVFCSARSDLIDEVVGLFHTLVKKVLDIDHSRGIVMGASSDIDGLVLDSLEACFQTNDGKLSEFAKSVIAEQLKKIKGDFEKISEKLGKAQSVEELYKLHLVYSSAHRHRLLRKLLETIEEHDSLCKLMCRYADSTMKSRNDLAHIRVVKNGFSRKLLNREGDEITADSVKQLRLELLEHQEALESLLVVLLAEP